MILLDGTAPGAYSSSPTTTSKGNMTATRNASQITHAMTKADWEKAQAELGRPVSFDNDGPRMRSKAPQATSSVESIYDSISARRHTGKIKY